MRNADAAARDQANQRKIQDEQTRSPDEAAFFEAETSADTPYLDLHEHTREDAWFEADRFIRDHLKIGETAVKFITGFGTGAIMSELHQKLRRHPHVKAFREAQRGAAMIVLLRQGAQK